MDWQAEVMAASDDNSAFRRLRSWVLDRKKVRGLCG